MSLEDQYDAWVRSVTGTGRHSATKQACMAFRLFCAASRSADSVRRMSSELTQSLRQDGLLGGKTAQPAPAAEPVKAGPENFNGLADRVRQQVLGQDAFVAISSTMQVRA